MKKKSEKFYLKTDKNIANEIMKQSGIKYHF